MQSAVEMQMQQPGSRVISASMPCNMEWRSSAVTIPLVSFAAFIIISLSIGFIVDMFITRTCIPSDSRYFATGH